MMGKTVVQAMADGLGTGVLACGLRMALLVKSTIVEDSFHDRWIEM